MFRSRCAAKLTSLKLREQQRKSDQISSKRVLITTPNNLNLSHKKKIIEDLKTREAVLKMNDSFALKKFKGLRSIHEIGQLDLTALSFYCESQLNHLQMSVSIQLSSRERLEELDEVFLSV